MSDVVSEFMCPCPDACGKALEVCECGDAAGYVKEIRDMQALGMPLQAIRDRFVEKYGPTVLASPPATGFGMMAYVMPPAAVLGGVLIATFLILKWARRKKGAPAVKINTGDIKEAEEMIKKWNS